MSDKTTPPPNAVAPAPAPDASRIMLLFVLIVATLYFGKEVLVAVVLALLLAFIIAPLVNLLRRIHLGRVPSVLLAVVLALGVVLAVGGVIGTQVAELSGDLPRYVGTVEAKIATVRQYTVGRLFSMTEGIGQRRPAATTPSTSTGMSQEGTPAPSSQPAPAAASTPASNPMQLAERYLSPIFSPLATFGIVFVVTVFALLQREDLRDRLIRLVGSDDFVLSSSYAATALPRAIASASATSAVIRAAKDVMSLPIVVALRMADSLGHAANPAAVSAVMGETARCR